MNKKLLRRNLFISLIVLSFSFPSYAEINIQDIESPAQVASPTPDPGYQQHWQLKQQQMLQPRSVVSAQVSTQPSFGKATGAGFNDTSLYFAGDIAVSIFFTAGLDGAWNTTDMESTIQKIRSALDEFKTIEPNARINFTYIKEVDALGNPKPFPATPLEEREYANDLRNLNNTHWAFLIVIKNESGGVTKPAYSFVNGPSVHLYKNHLDPLIIRHETMHIFGALDQYIPSSTTQGPTNTAGYLNVVNANSLTSSGKGFFAGTGEGKSDLMMSRLSSTIGTYSRGQVGWRDSDGDGIFDPLDTIPETKILSVTGNNPYTILGTVVDQGIPNELENAFAFSRARVSVNTITQIQFRVDNGVWVDVLASDGNLNSGREDFNLTIPALPKAAHTLEIRAINSVGNIETSYAKERIVVTTSSVTMMPTFKASPIKPLFNALTASFIVTPENYHGDSLPTYTVALDANTSFDMEDPVSSLKVRWDFEGDGIWDTGYSTTKTINYNYLLDKSYDHTLFATSNNAYDVAVAGNMAYVAGNSLKVVNIANPASPVLLSTLSTGTILTNVCVVNNYVYLIDQGSRFYVVDVTNPLAPVLKNPSGLSMPGLATSMTAMGSYVYVGLSFQSEVRVINVTNPVAPVIAGQINTTFYVNDIFALNNNLYVISNGSLQIFNISNPLAATLTGKLSGFIVASKIFVKGSLVYVGDNNFGLKIVSASNLASPQLVGSYALASPVPAINSLVVVGNTAILSLGSKTIMMLDVTNTANPVLIGQKEMVSFAYGLDGNTQNAYLANGSSGLAIFDMTKQGLVPTTLSKKILMEVMDTAGNIAKTSRNVWAVTYNHPPKIDSIEATDTHGVQFELAGVYANNYRLSIRDMFTTGSYLYILYEELLSVGSRYGFQIINITNPSSPYPIASPYLSSIANRDVFASGDLVYVVDDHGLKIFNTSNPNQVMGAFAKTGVLFVKVQGAYAYLTTEKEFLILNVGNPANPVLVGTYIFSPTNLPAKISDEWIDGRYAYLADATYGLKVIDTIDPANPKLVGFPPYYPNDIISIDNGYLYTRESDMMRIYDLINPINPQFITNYGPVTDLAKGFKLADVIYCPVKFKKIIQMIDVSNPRQPSFMKEYTVTTDVDQMCGLTDKLYVSIPNYSTKALFYIFSSRVGKLAQMLSASDPDQATTWDGLLEYRWDFNNDGIWDTEYDPTYQTIIYPDLNDNVLGQTLLCEIKDRFHATKKMSYFIAPINHRPTLNPISPQFIKEGDLINIKITGSDPDDDPLTYSASGLPVGASFDQNTQMFRWPANYGQAGHYSITFNVVDSKGLVAVPQTMSIDVAIVSPTVLLTLNTNSTSPAALFSLTVSGSTPAKLSSLYWVVVDKNNPSNTNIPGTVYGEARNLAMPQDVGMGLGQTAYVLSRAVTITNPGTYEVRAFAQDSLYASLGGAHQTSVSQTISVISPITRKWLANGNSTRSLDFDWKFLVKVSDPQAKKIVIAGWKTGYSGLDVNLSGDPLAANSTANYKVDLQPTSCTITDSPSAWKTDASLKKACYVIPVNISWTAPTTIGASDSLYSACQIRYNASTKNIEYKDFSASYDCGVAVFSMSQ